MFGSSHKPGAGSANASGAARDFFRACNVFCRPDADQVIVASVYNHGGLMAEKPGGATLLRFSDPTALNIAVRAALDACEYEERFNYRNQKRSDWPAYQASGYKTINRFEDEFVRLLIKGVNEKNLFCDVTTPGRSEGGRNCLRSEGGRNCL